MPRYLVAWSRSLRFLQLTIFILLFLLIMPLLSGHPYIIICFHLLLLNALLVSLSASERLPRLRLVLVMFWFFGIVLYFKATLFPGWGPFGLALFLGAAFYLLFLLGCTAAILIYVFKSPRITLDTIFAAVVAYFFLSIIFAILFTMLSAFNPNYFNVPASVTLDQFHLLTNEMIYFSLITIVGVGYGDILPLLPFSRMLAAVEAVMGHFYMAVLIGWLVGMFISQALRPSPEPSVPESQEFPEDIDTLTDDTLVRPVGKRPGALPGLRGGGPAIS
jgi:voltage-gated potassium channel